jgi:Transposase DNA-binding/Transposase DDE domain
MSITFTPNYEGLFSDKRIEKRLANLAENLSVNPVSVIRQISDNAAEQKAFYRLLKNNKVEEKILIDEIVSRTQQQCPNKHLLVLQDTSEINLTANRNKIDSHSGLGQSDKADNMYGFKLHPSLVIDAESLEPLGFSSIKVFHRPENRPDRLTRNYKKQPIEEKESMKWIESAQTSKLVLSNASIITFVEDREGDIYEQFARIPDERTHLIVRCRTTRKLVNGSDMFSTVEQTKISGRYVLHLPSDHRKKNSGRDANISVRFSKCAIRKPRNLSVKTTPKSLDVYCIIATEDGNMANRISWRLLTTHPITNFEQAMQIINWYVARWNIEQLFRILKKDGFDIENTEIATGWAIRRLIIIQLSLALQILQLNLSLKGKADGLPTSVAFDEEQVGILQQLNNKLQGKTTKLSNPYSPESIKWAAWIIARLGGWKAYTSQRPPGVITLKNGLDYFQILCEGVKLAKDVGTR